MHKIVNYVTVSGDNAASNIHIRFFVMHGLSKNWENLWFTAQEDVPDAFGRDPEMLWR